MSIIYIITNPRCFPRTMKINDETNFDRRIFIFLFRTIFACIREIKWYSKNRIIYFFLRIERNSWNSWKDILEWIMIEVTGVKVGDRNEWKRGSRSSRGSWSKTNSLDDVQFAGNSSARRVTRSWRPRNSRGS